MIFYLHYILLTSGTSGVSVLLGVFLKAYSDGSQAEIGVLLMTLPFITIIIRLIFCSMADRYQAYRLFLVSALCVMLVGFLPLIMVPFFANFYTNHPRISWYVMVMASYVGNGGLAVAWSLGESLAINKAQKTGTPYSRMRLMGTISWGVYGYIIGQINEVPFLPKFVPAFIILNVSVILEIILLLVWDKEDFVMFDPSQQQQQMEEQKVDPNDADNKAKAMTLNRHFDRLETGSSCAGGSLSLSSATGKAVREMLARENIEEIIHKKLGVSISSLNEAKTCGDLPSTTTTSTTKKPERDCEIAQPQPEQNQKKAKKNPQLILFKLICAEDGRIIKYFILYAIVGVLLAPIYFVFLSMDDLCKEKGCNFSNLAGLVLVSQAACETLCFLLLPWTLKRVSRSVALGFAFFILSLRYFFYAQFYYTANISPYWAVIGEWGHGMSYSIFATILAEVALMFANQTRWFIPEMRQLGYMSRENEATKEVREAEEVAMKMALRASMQALISGLMEGLGTGVGSLICGVIVENYSYIRLWQIISLLAAGSLVCHQVIELTKSRWSDTYQPRQGTKAYEIQQLTSNMKEGNQMGGGGGGKSQEATTELNARSLAA